MSPLQAGGAPYLPRLSTGKFLATNWEKWGKEKRQKMETVEKNEDKWKKEGWKLGTIEKKNKKEGGKWEM